MTGELSEVVQKLAYWLYLARRFPGCVIRRLFARICVWSAKKNPFKHSAMAGNWTRATERTDSELQVILSLSYHDLGHREDGQWDIFILPLSYHDSGHGEDRQWDTFILPLSYHHPGHREDRQWYSFIPPLSYHDPGHREERQWDTFILPLSCLDPGHREGR